MGPKNTAISVHLQPKSLPFFALLTLHRAPARGTGSGIHDDNGNGCQMGTSQSNNRRVGDHRKRCFLRFERAFASTATYDEMAGQLRKDLLRSRWLILPPSMKLS